MPDDEFLPFDLYFQYQIRYMYAGIESTMTNEAVHLCVLGLSVYTEVLGGLVTGNLRVRRNERKNYESFLPYLGDPYVELDREMKLHRMNLYTVVRSKLVHEFSPRPSWAYWINETIAEKPGIEYQFGDSIRLDGHYDKQAINYPTLEHLSFNIKEYYRDFKAGIAKYYLELKTEMKRGVFERPLFNNFMKATVIEPHI
jgi:hypothetical protein